VATDREVEQKMRDAIEKIAKEIRQTGGDF
jgi:hypothetical protein